MNRISKYFIIPQPPLLNRLRMGLGGMALCTLISSLGITLTSCKRCDSQLKGKHGELLAYNEAKTVVFRSLDNEVLSFNTTNPSESTEKIGTGFTPSTCLSTRKVTMSTADGNHVFEIDLWRDDDSEYPTLSIRHNEFSLFDINPPWDSTSVEVLHEQEVEAYSLTSTSDVTGGGIHYLVYSEELGIIEFGEEKAALDSLIIWRLEI